MLDEAVSRVDVGHQEILPGRLVLVVKPIRGEGGRGGKGEGGAEGEGEGGGAIRAIRVARIADPQFSSYSSRIGVEKKKSIIDSDCPDWKARLGLLGLQFFDFQVQYCNPSDSECSDCSDCSDCKIDAQSQLLQKLGFESQIIAIPSNPSNPSNPSRPQIFATNEKIQKIGAGEAKKKILFFLPVVLPFFFVDFLPIFGISVLLFYSWPVRWQPQVPKSVDLFLNLHWKGKPQ